MPQNKDKYERHHPNWELLDSVNYILTLVAIGLWSSHDENAFGLDSMILLVSDSPYNVQMSKNSFDSYGSLL